MIQQPEGFDFKPFNSLADFVEDANCPKCMTVLETSGFDADMSREEDHCILKAEIHFSCPKCHSVMSGVLLIGIEKISFIGTEFMEYTDILLEEFENTND